MDVVFGNYYCFIFYSTPSNNYHLITIVLWPSKPTYVAIWLVSDMMPMSTLGVGGIGWETLNPMGTAISAVSSTTSSTTDAMASTSVYMIYSIYDVVTSSVSCLEVLYLVSSTYYSLFWPTVTSILTLTQVRDLSAVDTVVLITNVWAHIIYCLEVIHKVYILHHEIYYESGLGTWVDMIELSLWVKFDAELPTIQFHGSHRSVMKFWVKELEKLLHYPDLEVYIAVYLHPKLLMKISWISTSLWLTSPILLYHWKFHPYGGGHNPLALFESLLHPPKLCQCCRLHIIRRCHVAQVHDYLHLFVDKVK